MKHSDRERLKKIISTWKNLSEQIQKRGITAEMLLEDEFSSLIKNPLTNPGTAAMMKL